MYILIAFVSGFLIPFIARRLGKILPATTGVILYQLPHIPRFPQKGSAYHKKRFKRTWLSLLAVATGYALLTSGLFFIARLFLSDQMWVYAALFIWISLCAACVDARFCLLPDSLTLPLLLLGFLFATHLHLITPQQSIYGAFFAYFIITLTIFLTNKSKYNIFGAGDSKMLIALGSWLGIEGINYTFLLSFLAFIIYSFFSKSRTGPYGPALTSAALMTFFLLYAK